MGHYLEELKSGYRLQIRKSLHCPGVDHQQQQDRGQTPLRPFTNSGILPVRNHSGAGRELFEVFSVDNIPI